MDILSSARGRFFYLVCSLAGLGVLIPFALYVGRQQHAAVRAPEFIGQWHATLTLERPFDDGPPPSNRAIKGVIRLWADSLGEADRSGRRMLGSPKLTLVRSGSAEAGDSAHRTLPRRGFRIPVALSPRPWAPMIRWS